MVAVTELVGVYHASGTLWGELSYWVGARLGRAHCALCDVTHGTFRPRAGWSACAEALPVPFVTYHLNDRPDDVVRASEGRTPCVLARTSDPAALHLLVGAADLEACDGDPAALVDAMARNASALDLEFGIGPGLGLGPEGGRPASDTG